MSTWVMLRGLGRDSRHWGAFKDAFCRSVADSTVAAVDLPGNGLLHRLASPTRIDAMTAHCRAQLQARALPPPYFVLALSLGAMVAVDWAHRYPQELGGCVLINTSLRPFNPFYRRLRLRNVPRLVRLVLGADGALARERTILRLTSRQHAADGAVLEEWLALERQCPLERGNILRQLLAAARYRAPRQAPQPPLLMLGGGADELVDPRCTRVIAGAWNADFAEHPNAGHDLALDDGTWIITQVRQWQDRLAAAKDRGQVDICRIG